MKINCVQSVQRAHVILKRTARFFFLFFLSFCVELSPFKVLPWQQLQDLAKHWWLRGETMKINGQGSKSVRGRNIIRCQQLIIVFLLKQKNCIRQNNNFHSFLSRSNRSPRRVSRVSRFLCVQLSHATNSPRLVAHPRGAIFTRFRRPTFTLICENERISKLFPWHDKFFLV